MNNLCECGCGLKTKINNRSKQFNRFVVGHNRRGTPFTGRKHSDESNLKNSISCTGKKHSDETKLKMSKSFTGRKYKHGIIFKGSQGFLGKKHSDKTKQKMRISAIKHIEKQLLNGEPIMPRVGDLERPFLNELQKYTEYKILRQDPRFRYVIGRFPDGYIPELKLFILFDELHHFKDKECLIYNKDSLCEIRDYESLKKHTILRVSEKEWLDNPKQIIKQFILRISHG